MSINMYRKNWSSEKLFFRLLNNKTNKTHWSIVYELRRRPTQDVYDRAFSLAVSRNDDEKIIGILILAQLGLDRRFQRNKTLALYFRLLDTPQSPKVISSILSAIGHNNAGLSNHRVSKLAAFKDHNYSDVRFALVHALSCVDKDLSIDVLIELMSDKHPDVRDWATFGIGSQSERNSPKIIEALKARLDDAHCVSRMEAIIGLALRKETCVKDLLIEELKDIDNSNSPILEAIEAFGDKDFIPILEELIIENKRSNQVNENWLIETLHSLKSEC
jgi:HEAT repeat protein